MTSNMEELSEQNRQRTKEENEQFDTSHKGPTSEYELDNQSQTTEDSTEQDYEEIDKTATIDEAVKRLEKFRYTGVQSDDSDEDKSNPKDSGSDSSENESDDEKQEDTRTESENSDDADETDASNHSTKHYESETEENESALDSQILNYDEYAVDAVHDNSYASEEAREYDEQYDAQSLGTRSDTEQFDEDGDEPETSALSEEQLEEQRDNGK